MHRASHAAEVLAQADAKADARAAVREAAAAVQTLADRLADRQVNSERKPPADEPKPAPPVDPDLGLTARNVAAATELVRRQRHIREQFQAIVGDRAAAEEALRREASALGHEIGELGESLARAQ